MRLVRRFVGRCRTAFNMPLVRRELVAIASRRRPYMLRTLFAMFFAVVLLAIYSRHTGDPGGIAARTGFGRTLLGSLIAFEFTLVYLFVPGFICGVISDERENGTLELLVITRLGLGSILVEKALGRAIVALSVQTAILPTMALVYALGGFPIEELVSGVVIVWLTVFQIGCCAVMCSALCQNATTAFIFCYLVGSVAVITPPMLVDTFFPYDGFPVGTMEYRPEWLLCGPYLFFSVSRQTGALVSLVSSIPLVLSGVAFLAFGRFALSRIDLVAPATSDVRWPGVSVRRMLTNSTELPGDYPVLWRERHRSTLNQKGVFGLIVTSLAIGTSAACLYVQFDQRSITQHAIYFAAIKMAGWVTVTAVIILAAAMLVTRERSRDTLNLILTTPISAAEIVRQKVIANRRLVAATAVPLVVTSIWSAYNRTAALDSTTLLDADRYLLISLGSIVVYLPTIVWFSVLVSLMVSGAARILMTTFGLLFVFVLSPLFLHPFLRLVVGLPNGADFMLPFSPAYVIYVAELETWGHGDWVLVAHFLGVLGCAAILRQVCLMSANRQLGQATK